LDKLYKTVNDIHGKIDFLVANAGIAGGQIVDEVVGIDLLIDGGVSTLRPEFRLRNANISTILDIWT
jgi:NADP-dependent 3-hydroxy acid dehydrogenase YdfG